MRIIPLALLLWDQMRIYMTSLPTMRCPQGRRWADGDWSPVGPSLLEVAIKYITWQTLVASGESKLPGPEHKASGKWAC